MRKVVLTSVLLSILLTTLVSQPAPKFSIDLPLARYKVSSPFGFRAPFMGGYDNLTVHKGVDLIDPDTKKNVQVLAAIDGVVVVRALRDPLYGKCVLLKSWDPVLQMNVYTLYGHMSLLKVRLGQHVTQGQTIGIEGSTGVSTGPHVHFEVLFDPMEYISAIRMRYALDNWAGLH